MKRLWLFAFVALTAGFFTSCDPVEPPIDVPAENFAPTITLLTENPTGGTAVFSTDATIEVEENGATRFFVGLKGEDLTDSLSTLEVFLNDEKVDGSLVSMTAADGTDIGTNNPALLVSPYNNGFDFAVELRTMEEYGVNTFRFLLTDSGALTDEVSITITTVEPVPVGTDLSGNLSGILLNQAGPAGTGGLCLDDGISLGSMDAAAEIRDNGIDESNPVATNWRQTISTVNGAIIRSVNRDALPEAYDFALVTTVEEVTAAWDTGNEISGNSTGVVNVGDEFIVQKADGTRNYLLQVAEVNVTTDDNGDNYVFNIKY
jgi:hypothetical protein